ncbi:hypothetical protein BTJ40_18140 [Microbulbifer sp. A4B17]|nr:hypothetical protein BTJ40_18140 [Microbulbifer sp. A4B17]
MAYITGGDGGPGVHSSVSQGISYTWSLDINSIEPNPTLQQNIIATLNSIFSIIGSVAQLSSQSISLIGNAGYSGRQIDIGGSCQSHISQGQLQAHGSEIDISGANQLGFSDISKLPTGTFCASPIRNITKGTLTIIIQ